LLPVISAEALVYPTASVATDLIDVNTPSLNSFWPSMALLLMETPLLSFKIAETMTNGNYFVSNPRP